MKANAPKQIEAVLTFNIPHIRGFLKLILYVKYAVELPKNLYFFPPKTSFLLLLDTIET